MICNPIVVIGIHRLYLYLLQLHYRQEMSCCCANQQEVMKNTQKLGRKEQVQRDINRSRQEQAQRESQGPRNRPGDADRQRQEAARGQTTFVEKVEREKQELILRYSEEALRERLAAQELQSKKEHFGRALQQDAVTNSRAAKEYAETVEQAEELEQLERIKPSKITISFSSIIEYFRTSPNRGISSDTSDVIEMKLVEIYGLYAEAKLSGQRLLLYVAIYVRFLEEVLREGYSQSLGDLQLKDTREFMRNNANALFLKLEALLAFAKEKFTKERSRILEEGEVDTSLEEIKRRSKIDDLYRRIQELLEENSRYKAENEQFTSFTIPGLREQLDRKELRGFEQVSEVLGQLQKSMAGRQEVEKRFQQLERLISGATVVFSSEQNAELLRAKDLAIQKLQAQVVRFEKEKSLLSEDTEPERKQLAHDLLLKDREIEGLLAELQEKERRISLLEAKQEPDFRNPQPETSETLLQNSRLAEELRGKEREITALRKKVDELEQEAMRDSDELQTARRQLSSAPKGKLQQQARTIASLEEELQECRAKLNGREVRASELERANLALNEKISHLATEVAVLKRNLQESSQREEMLYEERRRDAGQSEEQRQMELGEANKIASHRDALLLENQALRTKNISLASEVDNLTGKQAQQAAELLRLEEQLSEEQFKSNDAELRASKAEGEAFELKSDAAKVERARRQAEQARSELQRAKEQLQWARGELQRKRRQLQAEREEHSRTQNTLQEASLRAQGDSRRMRTMSFVEHRTLFIGDLLERRKGEKKYLMDAIEGLMMREIEKTKLLYDFRRDHKTNFHNFVDGHSNLVLVLETQKAVVACYYAGALQEEAPMTEEALIISLDSRKTYFLNTARHNPAKDPTDTRVIRGMVFDKYFLIFGNAEVRLRTGEARVFSNFGINSSYFDSRREKVAALLHDGTNNEVDLLNYEIHEVFFTEEFALESTA